MTVHEVRTCEPTLPAWEEMILKRVMAESPADAETAVRLAVRKTIWALAMRQVINGDAAATYLVELKLYKSCLPEVLADLDRKGVTGHEARVKELRERFRGIRETEDWYREMLTKDFGIPSDMIEWIIW